MQNFRRIITIVLLCFILIPENVLAQNIHLKVNIEGIKNNNVELHMGPYFGEGKVYEHKIQINTGELLTIDCNIKKLYQCRIINNEMWVHFANDSTWCKNRTVTFYAEPNDTITIEGKLKEYSVDYTITGNKINEQYSEYRKEYLPLFETEIKLTIEQNRAERSTMPLDSIKSKSSARWAYNKYLWLESLKFVEKHLDYEYSPRLIFPLYVPYDSLEMYKNKLHKNVFKADIGRRYLEEVRREGNNFKTESGKAPNFKFKSHKGKRYKLSDFRGKFIVLDFWGSWCGPCLAGIPKMKEYYNLYSEDIEIIGIACKDKDKNWRNAIQRQKLIWLNTLNSNKNDISELYGINSYPTKIIIDREGIIIKKFSGENEDFYLCLKELIDNEKIENQLK